MSVSEFTYFEKSRLDLLSAWYILANKHNPKKYPLDQSAPDWIKFYETWDPRVEEFQQQ